MSYTIKNLRDTADSAPKFGVGEMGEAHFPREELASPVQRASSCSYRASVRLAIASHA
jgi:hypothetical protein